MQIRITTKKLVEIEGKRQYLPQNFLNYGYELIREGRVVFSADGWTNPVKAYDEANKQLQALK